MGTIPPNAKRAYKGKIFELYQWEQKMFDGSTETFEVIKRPDTVQVITILDEKIIVTREEQPGRPQRDLGFYGGRVEDGEEPIGAAKRELMEESGLASDDWELWRVYEPIAKMDWKIYMFIARNCNKTGKPQFDSGEKLVPRAVDFDEFVTLFTADGFWAPNFSNDLLRLKLAGQLDQFKAKLFPSPGVGRD